MKTCLLFITLHLFLLSALAQEITRPVQLKSGILAKSKDLRNQFHLTDSLKKFHFKNRFYTLIQFKELPGATERRALAQDGIVLYDYIPDNTFLAEINDNIGLSRLKKSNISGIYTLHTTAKIAPDLVQELKHAARDADKAIAVSFYGNIDKAGAIAEFKKAGAQIIETAIEPARVVFIDASAAVVQKIAALPFVSYISSQYLKTTPLNYRNRGAHAVNPLSAPAGRNLQGTNVTVGIGDVGYPGSHIDLTGRLLNEDLSLADDHPTIVTGNVAGGGNLNPKYKGMAPEANIINKNTSQIVTDAPQLVTNYNMVLTNNSYGSGPPACADGGYNVLSNYIDEQMNTYPSLLHVFASGNAGETAVCTPYPAGFATVGSGFQSAKNVLTVGAIDNYNYNIPGFSSRGPAADGRLKPELVAGGVAIVSTLPENKYITTYGTSCSAPTVTGILALLYERYKQLHGGSNPSSALIKAVACNGAVDVGNPGPDYTFGFGNINARNSVEAIENNTWFTGTLDNGGAASFNVPAVPAGTAQIKILLYWNDRAASVSATSSLVNNLDLTVTTPDAMVHYPLVLDPSAANVNSVAVEGIDNRNNIEQVVINNPPAGNCTITVKGSGIAQGPQEYVVVYQVIEPGVKVEYPFGGETLVPGEQEIIRWNASADNTNSFTIEYSLNNGGTWLTIDNNVAATNRNYVWTMPASIATTTALIRVSRNSTAYTDVSDYSFVVLDTTSVVVTDTSAFAGNARLLWSSIPAATSYEVMMLRGKNMQVIASTTNTSYSLSGLSADSTYWVAVRGVMGSTAGRRSTAQCINPKFVAPPADLALVSVTNLICGRKNTSSQLGIVAPQVYINNRRYKITSGSASISYQVNDGIPVTETASINLAAYGNTMYTFAAGYDFSNTGNYSVKVWIDYPGDIAKSNDTVKFTVKHLTNDPIVLAPSFTEGFENAAVQTYSNGAIGFNGLDRCDFFSSSPNGRARTFVDAAMVRTGNRAVTLDQDIYKVNRSADSLIITFNLSNYISSDKDLWLLLYFRNEGIDFSAEGNKIWIRGSDRDAWIPVYTLPYNPADFGVYRAMPKVNINQTLAHASPVQTITSSFQVKCGQEGYYSVISVAPGANDGFTFDDITIGFLDDDVSMQQLVEPTAAGVPGGNQSITVQVKNHNPAAAITNVPVSYKVNSAPTVTENIPYIAPGATVNYTFTQTADMAHFTKYTIAAWVYYSTDTLPANDTLITTITKTDTLPPITSFPYLEGFESADPRGWYATGTNNSWLCGAPSGIVINKAANGSKAWVTNLSGNYNNNESSYLYSPRFDLSTLAQPVLSFSRILHTESNDYTQVEYSTDGQTWQTAYGYIGSIFLRWHVSSFEIPTRATSVRFRFALHSDESGTAEGLGIDDVHIYDKASMYFSEGIPGHSTKPVSGNNWIDFTSDAGYEGYKLFASINANGQDLGNVDASVYLAQFYFPYNDGHQYYLGRNIVIKPTNQPAAPVKVRFYFSEAEVESQDYVEDCNSCTKLPDAYAAGITQYSNAPAEEDSTLSNNISGTWRFITPSQVEVIPYDYGYYAEFEVSNLSEFWINPLPRLTAPLPLQLGDFTVTRVAKTALLQWATYSESNTSQFIIERSTDGVNFVAIGAVPASGNSNTKKQYRFTDEHPAKGINYYRLKQTDIDGKFSHSPIRKISVDDNFTITLKPNPVTQGVLFITSTVNCSRVELREATGRLVKTASVNAMQTQLPVHDVARGMYYITVVTDNGSEVKKVLIE
ncbi:S8 family serine peptidase [Niastella sp. OAS944]|uniref:S8 family serine peptidase n=1 Tax=Niastella sp. OAS944 TaxID=2664089 RepID=UPI00348317FE|nr:hypothetical protein [Chitinophagaceae bacterium OAS944]